MSASHRALTPEEIEKLPYRRNVGIMLLNAQGQVWVGQRRDKSSDAWQMPQGGIDQGETPRAAAFRELEEETGVGSDLVELIAESPDWIGYDLPATLIPSLWKGRYRGQEQLWYLMRFLGRDEDITIETKDQEFSDWRWVQPETLPDIIVPFKRDVYRQVVALFSPHF